MTRRGMSNYLIQHRRRWYVRVQLPKDVQHLFGQSCIRKTTGTDSYAEAKLVAPEIVSNIKKSIKQARATLRPPADVRVEDLAAKFKELKGADAERFVLDDVVRFVLNQTGQTLADWHKSLPSYDGLAFKQGSPQQNLLETLTGRKTPFLAHFDDWFKQAKVAKMTRDEYASAIRKFAASVKQPFETLSGKDVQGWINALLADDDGIDAKTVKKYLSGLKNYWGYLRGLELVDHDNRPFDNRTIKTRLTG
jgi:hypothetical protein